VVTVIKVKFLPVVYYGRLHDQSGLPLWTVQIGGASSKLRADILEPGDSMPIEIDVTAVIELATRQRAKTLADFAFRLTYHREADCRLYEVFKTYRLSEDKDSLVIIPVSLL
jgi:hypothetical protein